MICNYSPLLTDQYQFVMAYCDWQAGIAERKAVFHLSYRKLPPQSEFIITAGLQLAIEFLNNFRFSDDDIAYLKSLTNGEGQLFPSDFLEYLRKLRFTCDIAAIPEGNLIFPHEPVLRITGPILQCQLLETPLLNFFNFSSLVASKAAKVCLAAENDTVIEFGLRRAQGPDGGLTASRSAYIGGCHASSNTLAGKIYDLPIQGTQAHSWIMAFDSELEAFRSFADAMGDNTVLLVDTYHSINGIKNAIEIGLQLRKQGQELGGIRLDSGDLLELSKVARQLLDDAGLTNTKIVASGDLDEYIIKNLKQQQAPIDAWGVGTRLVTSFDYPALNGIYKLTAIQNDQGDWNYKMKISDDLSKSTLPGIQQIRRYQNQKDVVYDVTLNENLPAGGKDLLVPIFKDGHCVYSSPTVHEIRQFCLQEVHQFNKQAVKPYPVELSAKVKAMREKLISDYNLKK
jgi:nicotinate phosphoribosyltransferase